MARQPVEALTKGGAALPVFLCTFGYESPAEREQNERHGTDFESSKAIWIDAESEADALNWGREIAEQFYHLLCGRSWRKDNYACWTEPWRPLDHVLPIVGVGELPDFTSW